MNLFGALIEACEQITVVYSELILSITVVVLSIAFVFYVVKALTVCHVHTFRIWNRFRRVESDDNLQPHSRAKEYFDAGFGRKSEAETSSKLLLSAEAMD